MPRTVGIMIFVEGFLREMEMLRKAAVESATYFDMVQLGFTCDPVKFSKFWKNFLRPFIFFRGKWQYILVTLCGMDWHQNEQVLVNFSSSIKFCFTHR